ncbi:MAG: glycosyltransferase family 4 protein [Pyrinomonadaceae bacterium]|nr:glycosyltransferase family 4 protein [Pyrinomonadaceae bacterium]
MFEANEIKNQKSKIKNLKILFLTENYPPQRGGMAVSCDRIVRGLRENGVKVDVAHFSTRYLRWKVEQKINGNQICCPVREDVAHSINRLWTILENLNESYTHVVAFGGLLPMMASPVFAAWLEVPLITLIRGNDFDAGIFSLKRGDILRDALEKSTAICAVSKDKVEKISKLFPDTKLFWTPNGISLKDWEFSNEDLDFARNWRETNLLEGQKVLGFFGQLKRKKGGLFFLENLLRSRLANKFHLLLIGDVEPEMHDWLEKHRAEVSFSTLPFLDRYELLPYYAACDFVVIPSFYDGMPNVLLESAALGIPSISASTGGMRDVLEDGKTAILFEAGNDYDCRQAITKTAELTTENYQEFSKNCLELAKEYNPQTEAERYLQIFSETIKKRSHYA